MSDRLVRVIIPSADYGFQTIALRLPGILFAWSMIVWATLRIWNARSRQRRALARLVDDFHLLKDIGVSQEEALREAEKPFWRR
jgi:uncharacterized protein YjiS (DUF1127 family)